MDWLLKLILDYILFFIYGVLDSSGIELHFYVSWKGDDFFDELYKVKNLQIV